MQSVAEIVAEFSTRPWLGVTEADLGLAARVPTMLTAEESRLYHWLGRRVTGGGAVVDLGGRTSERGPARGPGRRRPRAVPPR